MTFRFLGLALMLLGFSVALVASTRENGRSCVPAALFGVGFGMFAATF